MGRRVVALVAALAIVVGACGGSDAAECDAIADDAIDQVQLLIDQVDEMTLDELAELDASFTADFESNIDSLVTRADAARCSDEEMTDLFAEKAGGLTSDSEFGQLFIEQFTSDDLFGE